MNKNYKDGILFHKKGLKMDKRTNRKCNHGFHSALSESLYSLNKPAPVCPDCGRNYSEEKFLEACSGLGINPSSIDPFQYPEVNKK